MKNSKLHFDEYYAEIYGQRWEKLRAALVEGDYKVLRPLFKESLNFKQVESLVPFIKGKSYQLEEEHYIMDPGSILAALALAPSENDHVLDMCAAPGGKSLVLLEFLTQGDGILWSNEISANRRQKLKAVIQQYVPKEVREKIFIKGKDGSKYGLSHKDYFDSILLDAPCSGERHLLKSPKELEKWSPKRTKKLAATQYSLLCSALLSVKAGGKIVYSTCSLSPLENDLVIKKLISKKAQHVKVITPEINSSLVEKTEYGYMVLPDKGHGAGPLYFSVLQKSTEISDKE